MFNQMLPVKSGQMPELGDQHKDIQMAPIPPDDIDDTDFLVPGSPHLFDKDGFNMYDDSRDIDDLELELEDDIEDDDDFDDDFDDEFDDEDYDDDDDFIDFDDEDDDEY